MFRRSKCTTCIAGGFLSSKKFGDPVTHLHPQIEDVLGICPDKAYWERKQLSKDACIHCFGKLNRLQKTESDISTKLRKLQEENTSLQAYLRQNKEKVIGSQCIQGQAVASTPSKGASSLQRGMKRTLQKTPTPKKTVKRALLRTPQKVRPILPKPTALTFPRYGVDKATQCGPPIDPVGTVKVVVTYPSQQRAKYVKDVTLVKFLKALADGATTGRLAGIIYQHDAIRPLLHQLMCSGLPHEVTALCSDHHQSILKDKSADDLQTIDWNDIIQEWQERSSLLYSVLESVACKTRPQPQGQRQPTLDAAKHHPCIGLAGSILLFRRNPKMCRLQMAVGLVLDRSGTTDEAISLLQRMGVSVTPQSIYDKTREMLLKHKKLMEETVGAFVEQKERQASAQRSYHAFIEDCLDAFTLAKASQHFGLSDFDAKPTTNEPPVLHNLRSDHERYLWLINEVRNIRKQLLSPDARGLTELGHVARETTALEMRENLVKFMQQEDGKYKCEHCAKVYIRKKSFLKHLQNVHSVGVDMDVDSGQDSHQTSDNSSALEVVASFCRMGYLYRDTADAYRMADGDRIFRNAKFEMLYAWSLKHTKYRLWLWRMLAYEMAILSPSEAFDYKWNTSVNIQGGIGNNIPNDNAVELQVGEIKKRLQREGSNKTFRSAQTICQTSQIVQQVFRNLQKVNKGHVTSKERPESRKLKDVKTLVEEILEANAFDHITPCATFPHYRDPLAKLDVSSFHSWVNEQKEVAAIQMVK